VGVALVKGPVQALLLDEDLGVPAVGLDKVLFSVVGQEVRKDFRTLERVVRFGQVEDKVPLPVGHLEEVGHAADEHPEKGGSSPDGRKSGE
jgi:hypothetical protein